MCNCMDAQCRCDQNAAQKYDYQNNSKTAYNQAICKAKRKNCSTENLTKVKYTRPAETYNPGAKNIQPKPSLGCISFCQFAEAFLPSRRGGGMLALFHCARSDKFLVPELLVHLTVAFEFLVSPGHVMMQLLFLSFCEKV